MGNNQSSSGGSSSKPSVPGLRSRSNTLDNPSRPTSVDGGYLEPQSLLYSHVEYSRPTVHKLIQDRRLSPFYLGLLDFEEDWDLERLVGALGEAEQQATQNLKDALAAATEAANEADAQQLNCPPGTRKHKESIQAYNLSVLRRERLAELLKAREKRGGGALQPSSSKAEQAKLYRGVAFECPICFLYYPPNMVHTRCCDQPICTECFVQIKRADPTPTHLESEPACCPFCMEPNFGGIYTKPAPARPAIQQNSSGASGSSTEASPAGAAAAPKSRRKSFAHTEKAVVTTDMIHPDWEEKLETMKAAVARRANRRIVFRQVGDRLIPVGIASGRGGDGANPTMATTTLPPNFLSQIAAALDASNENGGSSSGRRRASRSSRRHGAGGNDELMQLLEQLGLGGGPDIEEMMVQEAMRLSQLEEEERQKKTQEEEARKGTAGTAGGASPPAAAHADVLRTPRMTGTRLSEAMGASALSTSPSSPLRTSAFSRNEPTSLSPLGALAGGEIAASAISPSTSSSFPQSGESTAGSSLERGIVGAGLAAASTSRAESASLPPLAGAPQQGQPPQLAPLSAVPQINLDIPSTPLEAPSLDTPVASRSPVPLPPITASDPVPDPVPLSARDAGLSRLPPSLTSASSAVSIARSESTSSIMPSPSPSPSAGYQPLPDESDTDAASLASGNHAWIQGEHVESGAASGQPIDL
ncbi:hypothetical protein JCM11641_003768 [Rhodosporidiobolus odoratus]